MKNKTLIYVLLGAGALLLIAAKRKSRGRVIVPEPDIITAEQFRKPSLIQRAAPVVRQVTAALQKRKAERDKKKAVEAFLQKFGRKKVGNFPDIY